MYREQSNLAFMLLVKSQKLSQPLKLEDLMAYPLTPVPASIGTADGFLYKTNKASLLHYIAQDCPKDLPYPEDALHIEDGNAMIYTLSNLPPTFGEVSLQILDRMISKHDFIFSTDSYHMYSVKGMERLRRGSSPSHIVDGPATRRPTDMKEFMTNETNKKQFFELVKKMWGSDAAAARIEKAQRAMVVIDGVAYSLSSSNGKVLIFINYNIH